MRTWVWSQAVGKYVCNLSASEVGHGDKWFPGSSWASQLVTFSSGQQQKTQSQSGRWGPITSICMPCHTYTYSLSHNHNLNWDSISFIPIKTAILEGEKKKTKNPNKSQCECWKEKLTAAVQATSLIVITNVCMKVSQKTEMLLWTWP